MSSEAKFFWCPTPYERWRYSEQNGWVNTDESDDPATPTEIALLDEITRLGLILDRVSMTLDPDGDDLFHTVKLTLNTYDCEIVSHLLKEALDVRKYARRNARREDV